MDENAVAGEILPYMFGTWYRSLFSAPIKFTKSNLPSVTEYGLILNKIGCSLKLMYVFAIKACQLTSFNISEEYVGYGRKRMTKEDKFVMSRQM